MGIDIPDRFEERCDPQSCALVVVDMQNDFADPAGHCARFVDVKGFREPIGPLAELADTARRAGVPVFYTQQVQRPDGLYASPVWLADNLRVLEAAGLAFEPTHCMEGTWGVEVIAELAPRAGDVVVPKTRRTAFEGTNLAKLLRVHGRTTLVVGGIAATGCVESTVRDAIEKDFFVVVPSDAIGDAMPEQMEAATAAFGRLLQPGDLTSTAAVVERWG